jgi:hypothetical protein
MPRHTVPNSWVTEDSGDTRVAEGYQCWNDAHRSTGRRLTYPFWQEGEDSDNTWCYDCAKDKPGRPPRTGQSAAKETNDMATRHCISKRIRERYVPPLPYDGRLPSDSQGVYWETKNVSVLCWILLHDWKITDSERKAMLRAIYMYDSDLSEAEANKRASNWAKARDEFFGTEANSQVAHICGITQYRPCATCSKVVRACEQCGKCPACDTALHINPCGCCDDCRSLHDVCDRCANEHSKSADLGCKCIACKGCEHKVRGEMCSECGTCEDCCSCYVCPCGTKFPDRDSAGPDESQHCDLFDRHCRACCRCISRDRSESRSIHGAGKHPVNSAADRAHFPLSRMAGAEVEYNACVDFRPIKSWAMHWGADIHSDGSCGWEAVTSPAGGDFIGAQLTDLCQAFTAAKAKADHKCGVHVHVDASDLRWPDMARLLRLYSRLEPALYLLAGQSRLENTFCKPWEQTMSEALDSEAGKLDPKGAILRVLYSSKNEAVAKDAQKRMWTEGQGPTKKASFRYRGLNIAPWIARLRVAQPSTRNAAGKLVRKGKRFVSDATVEFRLHRGTLDVDSLVPWAQACVRIVDFASGCSERDVASLPRSQIRALLQIAPESKRYIESRLADYRRNIRSEMRMIGYHPKVGYSIGKQDLYFANESDTMYGIINLRESLPAWWAISGNLSFQGERKVRKVARQLDGAGYVKGTDYDIAPYVPGPIDCPYGIWNVEFGKWGTRERDSARHARFHTVESAQRTAQECERKMGGVFAFDVRRFDGTPVDGVSCRLPTMADGRTYQCIDRLGVAGRFYDSFAEMGGSISGYGNVVTQGPLAFATWWATFMRTQQRGNYMPAAVPIQETLPLTGSDI